MTYERNQARARQEEALFREALENLGAAVTGKEPSDGGADAVHQKTAALDRILKFLHQKPLDVPKEKDPMEVLRDQRNVSCRTVYLEGAWYKNAVGPYLGQTRDGGFAALIPSRTGYLCYDENGKSFRLNEKTAVQLQEEATCFYIPLPPGTLRVKDLWGYMLRALSLWDIGLVIGAAALVSVLAMTIPAMTKLVFSGLIPSGSVALVLPVFVLMVLAMLSNHVIGMIRTQSVSLVKVRAGASLQAAVMARVMAMPAGFFRDHTSGEIAARLGAVDRLTSATVNAVVTSGLTSVFSLVYLAQIYAYAPTLMVPAVVVLALQTLLTLACVALSVRRTNRRLQKETKVSGLTLSILNGIQKIRLTGAEKRIFAKWAGEYRDVADLNYRPPRILLYRSGINSLITILGLAVMYYVAAVTDVTQANYMAFYSAYGMVAGAFAALTGIVGTLVEFGPLLNMVKPILETEPEIEPGKTVPEELSGSISVSHLSFRYNKNGPMLLEDISLTIHPGDYVGIVGSTGCGKSTLMRLMLGFEKPEQGAIYYDDLDLNTLSVRGLRRKIGTVLQNGQLLQGSIFTNLMIARPNLTVAEAWEALEMAALADDVRRMPMGLHTLLGENGSGLSGGQKQRLLIARALVGKPKIVFMDEATSALDNVVQAQTVKTLDELNCTRVIIAHRLSTIQNCSRILVMDGGRIVEEGTYQELIALGGVFAALVARQRLDT